MPETLTKLAYQALQQGRAVAGVAHKDVSTRLMKLLLPEGGPSVRPVDAVLLRDLQAAQSALQEVDWRDAEEGLYPTGLLFDAPWLDWAARYPLLWLDLPSTWSRRGEVRVKDLPPQVRREEYPDDHCRISITRATATSAITPPRSTTCRWRSSSTVPPTRCAAG